MSDTQQRLITASDAEKVLRQLAHINPNASTGSLIQVKRGIAVPLQQFGESAPCAELNLRGATVKVTRIDAHGNPSLFSVHKGKAGSPLAVVKPARPAGYPCKVEFSSAAIQSGVVVFTEKAAKPH